MTIEDLEKAVAAYLARCIRTDNGCLVNPRIGPGCYGEIKIGGRRIGAHRAVAALNAGRMPTRDEVARHGCDNKPCAEPTHISLGTPSQNSADHYARQGRPAENWLRGEERSHALLTERVVCEMRRLARGGTSLGLIAEQFGTPYSPTRMAIRGETWAHVTSEPPVAGRTNRRPNPHAYRFTRREEADRVAELVAAGVSLAGIARRLGISRHTAWRLSQLGKGLAS